MDRRSDSDARDTSSTKPSPLSVAATATNGYLSICISCPQSCSERTRSRTGDRVGPASNKVFTPGRGSEEHGMTIVSEDVVVELRSWLEENWIPSSRSRRGGNGSDWRAGCTFPA